MSNHADETPTVSATPLSTDERAELARLRAEVTRLRSAAASGASEDASAAPVRRRWRSAAAVLLITVSCVLAPVSVASVWARSLATDTDRYVATVAPLAHHPAVQRAITTKLTDLVFQYVDVEGLTEQAMAALQERDVLPPALASRLQGLAVPLANGVRSFAADRIQQVVQSDAFGQAWEQANRTAHEQLVAALSGRAKSVTVEGNAVKVDLAAFLTVVRQRLVDSGFELAARIPQVGATFTIVESRSIGTIQRGFDVLNTLGYWLPIVLVVLAALGLYLARDHRLAFVGTGLGLAVAMLATGIALQVARTAYLGSVPPDAIAPDAAAALYDAVARFLHEAVRALALVAVLVAGGAFLTGPSVTATTVRSWCVTVVAAAKSGLATLGLRMDGITRAVAPRARLVRSLVVASAIALVVLYRYRTPALVLWVAGGTLAALAVVELLAVQPRQARAART